MKPWEHIEEPHGNDTTLRNSHFGDGKMKYFRIILLTISIIGFLALNGYADRLYTWTDDKGVTHISQHPPPKDATLQFITDYTSRAEEQNQAVQKQEEKPKQIEPERRKDEAGKVLEPEIYDDDDDSDTTRSRHKRKARKEYLEKRKGDESPDEASEKAKRKHRSHGSIK